MSNKSRKPKSFIGSPRNSTRKSSSSPRSPPRSPIYTPPSFPPPPMLITPPSPRFLKPTTRPPLPPPPMLLTPPSPSLRNTSVTHRRTSISNTRSPCPVPYLYLDPVNDSMFQVSITNPDNLLFRNTAHQSTLDCGYKALSALGLRDKYMTSINSAMVNSRGHTGILFGDMAAYIEHIYNLPVDAVDFYMGIQTGITSSRMLVSSLTQALRTQLQESHATLLVVFISTKPKVAGPHNSFGHYIVAYKHNGTLYYYNPQSNTPGSSINRSLSTDIVSLINNLYPKKEITDWANFVIKEHGTPKPVIKNRLKSFLKFVGGRKMWV